MKTFYENPGTFDKFKGFPDDPLTLQDFQLICGSLEDLFEFQLKVF